MRLWCCCFPCVFHLYYLTACLVHHTMILITVYSHTWDKRNRRTLFSENLYGTRTSCTTCLDHYYVLLLTNRTQGLRSSPCVLDSLDKLEKNNKNTMSDD